jgi:EAL domain-containing protein (putative c-di-GMP-specific phosphodiesterase class I)
VRSLQTLKRLRIRIALDDFGTGYSSRSQLRRLRVDIVKVEEDFAGTPHHPTTHPGLIHAVMDIGKNMHLTTVAERIATPAQLRPRCTWFSTQSVRAFTDAARPLM